MNDKRRNFIRTVHLGVYGNTAASMIKCIALSVRNTGTHLDSKSFRAADVSRATDGEITLDVYGDDNWDHPINKTVFSQRRGYSDAQIRKWLAGIVKGLTKRAITGNEFETYHDAAIRAEKRWSRTNKDRIAFKADLADFAVDEAYALYETLLGRKTSDKFDKRTLDTVVGRAYDPVRVELEQYRLEETRRIEEELKAELDKISEWSNKAWSHIYDEISRKQKEAKDAAEKRIESLSREIDESLGQRVEVSEPSETVNV